MIKSQIEPIELNIYYIFSAGVYSSPACRPNYLNHEALIVGYDDDDKFWTVKNSWGTGWGEGGYVRIAKDRGNMCGVAAFAGTVADIIPVGI